MNKPLTLWRRLPPWAYLYTLAAFNFLLDIWLRIKYSPRPAESWYHPQKMADSLYRRSAQEPLWYVFILAVNLLLFLLLMRRGKVVKGSTLLFLAALVRLLSLGARLGLGEALDHELSGLFFSYGQEFATGSYPAIEYPQLALLFFTFIYKLSWGSLELFMVLFPLWMIPFELLTVFCIYRIGQRLGRAFAGSMGAAFYATCPFLLHFWFCKFDALPTAFLLLAVYFFIEERPVASALATTAGLASKWLPVLVVPIFCVSLWKRKRYRHLVKYGGAAVVAALALLLPFWLLNPERFTFTYTFHARRTMIGQSFLFIVAYLVEPALRHAGIVPWNPAEPPVFDNWLASGIQVIFLAAVFAIFALRPPRRERDVVFASLMVVTFILLNRIFSPQYILIVAGACLAALVVAVRSPVALALGLSALAVLALANFSVWPLFASFWFAASILMFTLAWTLWLYLLLGGWRHRAIVAVLISFFVLSALYSLATPLLESPGEAYYVKQFNDASVMLRHNPQFDARLSPRGENKNRLVHTEKEKFPYRGPALTLHLVRLLSVLMGTATVFVTYRLALEVFPGDGAIALGAAAVNAFVPGFLFTSGTSAAYSLAILLSSLALLLVVRFSKQKAWPRASILAVLGVAVFMAVGWSVVRGSSDGFVALRELYFSFWGLFGWLNISLDAAWYVALSVLALAGVAGLLLRRPEVETLPLAILVAWVALTLILALWRVGSSFPAISALSVLLFWGLSRWLPKRYHSALGGAVGGGLFLLALACPFYYIAPAYAKPLVLAAEDIPAAVRRLEVDYEGQMRLAGYQLAQETIRPGESLEMTLYWEALAPMERDYRVFIHLLGRDHQVVGQGDGPPGPHAYPTHLWAPGDIMRHTYQVPTIYTATVPTLCRLDVGLYHRPTMETLESNRHAFLDQVRLVPWQPQEYVIAHQLNFDLAALIALVGYDLEEEPEKIRLTLYWQARQRIEEDYTVFIHLLDDQGHIQAQQDGQPLNGDYPTSAWDEGQVVADEHALSLGPDVPPGQYRLEVGMYRLSDGWRLPVSNDQGQPLEKDRILLEGELAIRR